MSAKFHTCFCNCTHALNSSVVVQRRIATSVETSAAPDLTGVLIAAVLAPAAWLVATALPSSPATLRPIFARHLPILIQYAESALGTCDSSCATPLPDLLTNTPQYSPAQKTNRRSRLPIAAATPPAPSACSHLTNPRSLASAPLVPAPDTSPTRFSVPQSLLSTYRADLRCSASQIPRSPRASSASTLPSWPASPTTRRQGSTSPSPSVSTPRSS